MARQREYDPEMIPTAVTTTIPYGVHKECIANGWSWKDIFMMGYRLRMSGDDAQKRIFALESQVSTLKNALHKKEDKPAFKRFRA